MKKKRAVFVAGGIIACAGLVWAAVTYWPLHVERTITHTLVGLDDPVFSLLRRDARLDEIQAAIAASGKGVDGHIEMGSTLLSRAVVKGRRDVALWLLEQGADPNGASPDTAPLGSAIWQDDLAMVKVLLDYGADPEKTVGFGETAMEMARDRGNRAIIDALARAVAAKRLRAGEPDGEANAQP